MTTPIVVGVTLGDVGGIGPEVALKAVCRTRWPGELRFVLVGSFGAIQSEAARLGIRPVQRASAEAEGDARKVVCWEPPDAPRPARRPGAMTPSASKAAVCWIEAAARRCLAGGFDCMVTGPICKEGLRLAGIRAPGHTELLARLTGVRDFAMMLVGGPLRVVLVTRHIPLSQVERAITIGNIVAAGRLAAEGLRWIGIRRPRIGVCGLNPHAGDGGTLGRTELEKIAPAVRRLRAQGVDAVGPVPVDVIFHKALKGNYDAVLAMYHDQGLAPLKMIAFERGVNITLGLPLVRTSPDHGVAFDIAGTGGADPSSMIEAIKLAARLAVKRNPWRTNTVA